VEYFEDSGINFQYNEPAIIPPLVLAGELRRNLFLCIKEALNNIVKHAQATEASLTFSIVGNTLVTTIKDNGIGITQDNKFGNGLTTMKERLNKFGGSMDIEINNGTILIFKVNIIA
jgi:two-component system sensor histidine kinase DesK